MTSLTDDGVTPDVAEAGPADGGEAVAEAPQPEADVPVEPEYEYLEVDEDLAAKHVRIKRDGEEISVPLREALDGYNANSVATQRFQEAKQIQEQAEQALRLQQAFQANPALTVQVLAQQAGMTVEQFVGLNPAQQQQAIEDNQSEPEYLDPLEQKVATLEQQLAQQVQREQEREADLRLKSAVDGLKQQYQATDEQVRAVVTKAIETGLGVEAFPLIYQSLAYEMQSQAQAQHTASQEATAQERQAAAARAAATVTSGVTSVPTSGQVAAENKRPMTPREAAEMGVSAFFE